ncbi:AMP-binding enzyme [Salsipaludibacter albus]|uniref:AMP-binding enzyme n=1 Tax=Salsipaludibacter albus TaxID=2849650 RepID=UPI001EE45A93|nr:hypothetical protein [Salsipaludibacter albus]MBY5162721.1 hypothetical protein [Salsipaludibacter albus]
MGQARQIEDALRDHAHVAECTVAPLADLYERETVTAFVVMRDNVEASLDSVWDHLRSVLPGDHQPDEVHVVDTLPDDPAAEAKRRRDDADG